MNVELREKPVKASELPLVRLPREGQANESVPLGSAYYHYLLRLDPPPFKGRATVESYDPAGWPYPDDEDAEGLWDEPEE